MTWPNLSANWAELHQRWWEMETFSGEGRKEGRKEGKRVHTASAFSINPRSFCYWFIYLHPQMGERASVDCSSLNATYLARLVSRPHHPPTADVLLSSSLRRRWRLVTLTCVYYLSRLPLHINQLMKWP